MDKYARDLLAADLFANYYDVLKKDLSHYVGYSPTFSNCIDDCIQDTFERFLLKYESLKMHPNHAGWLVVVARKLMSNKIKRTLRHSTSSLDHPNAPDPPDLYDGIEDWLDRQEAQELANKVLDLMTEKEKPIVIDRLGKGMTSEETALRNHTTIGAVKAIVHRVRKRAKKTPPFLILFVIMTAYLLQNLRT